MNVYNCFKELNDRPISGSTVVEQTVTNCEVGGSNLANSHWLPGQISIRRNGEFIK